MDQWTQPGGQSSPGWSPPPGGAQPGGPQYGPPPQVGGYPPPPPAPPSAPPPVPQQRPGYPAAPSSGAPASPAGGSPPAVPPPVASKRRAWPMVVALVLVVLLTAAVGVQAWQLRGMSSSLDRANDRLDELSQAHAYSGERLDALEDRASELERIAGDAFDTEAVAAAVLPSVFMVEAGPFSGTAFAVGTAAEDGGTNLFTNYHVVEDVWESGDRAVTLQRTSQSYPAEIIDVEPGNDVAWLHTSSSFSGLSTTGDEVRAGQPIIAVGAPQGLTDTVTSGVVSTPAQRLPDGSGPWIQFDAAINPGNSGGPVINSGQEVVGIATAKGRETEGIGFAVPIEIACDLFDIC